MKPFTKKYWPLLLTPALLALGACSGNQSADESDVNVPADQQPGTLGGPHDMGTTPEATPSVRSQDDMSGRAGNDGSPSEGRSSSNAGS